MALVINTLMQGLPEQSPWAVATTPGKDMRLSVWSLSTSSMVLWGMGPSSSRASVACSPHPSTIPSTQRRLTASTRGFAFSHIERFAVFLVNVQV